MLGAILIDPACITRVMEYIKPESFYRPQHQELFSALTRMFVSSQTIRLYHRVGDGQAGGDS